MASIENAAAARDWEELSVYPGGPSAEDAASGALIIGRATKHDVGLKIVHEKQPGVIEIDMTQKPPVLFLHDVLVDVLVGKRVVAKRHWWSRPRADISQDGHDLSRGGDFHLVRGQYSPKDSDLELY